MTGERTECQFAILSALDPDRSGITHAHAIPKSGLQIVAKGARTEIESTLGEISGVLTRQSPESNKNAPKRVKSRRLASPSHSTKLLAVIAADHKDHLRSLDQTW